MISRGVLRFLFYDIRSRTSAEAARAAPWIHGTVQDIRNCGEQKIQNQISLVAIVRGKSS